MPPGRLVTLLLVLITASCGIQRPSAPGLNKPVSFAILEDYDKGQDLRQVESDFALMEELGIHDWRGSFGWDDYEPEPGAYDFDWLNRFAELAARHHLRLRPYLAYTPAWAARPGGKTPEAWNDPPRQLEEWQRFVSRMATEMRRHPNVVSFEFYNEENAPLWWDGTPTDYARLLTSGSNAARVADPRARILFGGLVYPDLPWMQQTCALDGTGASFDVLPIHAYPETWMPPEVTVENYLDGFFHTSFLPQVDRVCGAKPIWINEAGFPTVHGRESERAQANWWARAVATFLADPRVQELGVYELRDVPPTAAVIGEQENYHLGLTYPDGERKLAFRTVKLLVRLLDTGTINVADDAVHPSVIGGTAGELHHHCFVRPDGKRVLFLWDKRAAPLVDIALDERASRVTEFALDGSPLPYTTFAPDRIQRIQLAAGEVRIFELAP